MVCRLLTAVAASAESSGWSPAAAGSGHAEVMHAVQHQLWPVVALQVVNKHAHVHGNKHARAHAHTPYKHVDATAGAQGARRALHATTGRLGEADRDDGASHSIA